MNDISNLNQCSSSEMSFFFYKSGKEGSSRHFLILIATVYLILLFLSSIALFISGNFFFATMFLIA